MNKAFLLFLILIVFIFAGCSTRGKKIYGNNWKKKEVTYFHPTMKPYTVRGIRYRPAVVSVGKKFEGIASWYGPDFHKKLTSNGEVYDMHAMTAAHKTLPMNTIVKVTNQSNGISIVLRVNDRGPFIATRIIDLSNAAAHKIKMVGKGTAPVVVEVLGFQSKGKKTIPPIDQLKPVPQELQKTNYAIQIGSFSSFDGAAKIQEKHNGLDGYKTVIKDMDDEDESRIFKVWLSGFKTETEARKYKANSIFRNSFVIEDN